jgi:hypothetical protein
MERKEEIRKILGSQTTNKSVHAQALWQLIDTAESLEEKIELLEIVFTELISVEKHNQILSNKGIDVDEWNDLDRKYTRMVMDFSRNAFFSTNNSKEFSGEILRLLDFFKAENEKAFCLAIVAYSTNIVPYHNLPGDSIRISAEEYRQLLLANKDKAALVKYLVNLPFYDWTEAASQVLQVIDDVTDKKLRIALLSYFMTLKIREVTRD